MIGVDYSTTLSEWLPSCPLKQKMYYYLNNLLVFSKCELILIMYFSSHRTLEGRTEKLMKQLLAVGIGDRPIIFLAHSMGGLLVKNMLVAGI